MHLKCCTYLDVWIKFVYQNNEELIILNIIAIFHLFFAFYIPSLTPPPPTFSLTEFCLLYIPLIGNFILLSRTTVTFPSTYLIMSDMSRARPLAVPSWSGVTELPINRLWAAKHVLKVTVISVRQQMIATHTAATLSRVQVTMTSEHYYWEQNLRSRQC